MKGPDAWCALADEWLRGNGLEDLDQWQRSRFDAHRAKCRRCADVPERVGGRASRRAGGDWPHVADDTLDASLAGSITPGASGGAAAAIEQHLAKCDRCAERLVARREHGDADPKTLDTVVGRSEPVDIQWDRSRAAANLTWLLDQPGASSTRWSLRMRLERHRLHAELEPPQPVAGAWKTFGVVLTSGSRLQTLLMFSPAHLSCDRDLASGASTTWRAAATLTRARPAWAGLIAPLDEANSLLVDAWATGERVGFRLPLIGALSPKRIERGLSGLFRDVHGRPLQLVATGAASGLVLTPGGRQVGTWTAHLENNALAVHLVPQQDRAVRLSEFQPPRAATTVQTRPAARAASTHPPRAVESTRAWARALFIPLSARPQPSTGAATYMGGAVARIYHVQVTPPPGVPWFDGSVTLTATPDLSRTRIAVTVGRVAGAPLQPPLRVCLRINGKDRGSVVVVDPTQDVRPDVSVKPLLRDEDDIEVHVEALHEE